MTVELDADKLIEARIIEAFWRNVPTRGDDDCWLWTANTSPKGYGVLHNWKSRKNIRAHRLSFMIHHGPIPDGMMICHKCDQPACCNPNHLYAGTNRDNVRDRDLRGRYVLPPHVKPKFSDAEITQILADPRSSYAVAKEKGVDSSTIRRIRRNGGYKHIVKLYALPEIKP